jgi:hypothetical protein
MTSARYPRVNPRSGLTEQWDSHFEVPSVAQRSLNALRFNGQTTAVHSVPLENRLTLDFYARLGRSDELVVTFHGAYRKDQYLYPRFERVRSLEKKFPAHIAFADPTLRLDPSKRMLLSWYLGGPGWDPMDDILRVITRAKGRTGSKHLLFIGGSGGGHTALRISAHVPGSLAYVQAPATDINRCFPTAKKNYFSTVWPQWDPERLLAGFPERFNMPRLYRRRRPDNFVYYAQSTRDPHYLETHFAPFRDELALSPSGADEPRGTTWLALYDGVKEGHGAMTPPEFSDHLVSALGWWRAKRPANP